MNVTRYKLEPYTGSKSRHTCPACSKPNVFTRYVEVQTGSPINSNVGRCNREINCGYHYPPKRYFEDTPYLTNKTHLKPIGENEIVKIPPKRQISLIPEATFKQSLQAYSENHFTSYLSGLFGSNLTEYLTNKYAIGTAKYWPGATVFWQIDAMSRIRAGKIMLYNFESGKRVKDPFNHITWVHKVLKFPDFTLEQCFFGEHLLANNARPVAIVEGEKTAIISSVFMPNIIWLAVGSVNNLQPEKCKVLFGRKVVLYPDLHAFDKWNRKAKDLSSSLSIQVSSLLEERANEFDKRLGLDIADYLIQRDSIFGWALSKEGYPIFWDYP